MKIDCISDLHGHYPQLEGGDLLIVAGDLVAYSTGFDYGHFYEWLHQLDYRKKVVIAGNHDSFLQKIPEFFKVTGHADYLCDSGTELEGLKIWGSPWTLKFKGQNPKAMAFSLDTEEELAKKWAMIPEDTDILITHSPYWGILDKNTKGQMCGSFSLNQYMSTRIRPRISVCGHIHESYGKVEMENEIENVKYQFVNASHVNERYEPVNAPIRIDL